MKPDFSSRSMEVEIMDDLNCSGEVVDQTLRELETINRFLGGNSITIDGIKELISASKNNSITIIDLGCGGGDMLIEIAKFGRKENLSLRLIGIDANPNIIAFAKRNCENYQEIEFIPLNIFSEEFKRLEFDIAVATLVTHHFSNDDLVALIKNLKHQSRIGFVINDIHRHWLAYYSIKHLTRFFSKSAMVKFDAPLSVLRSFTQNDWFSIFAKGGIKEYSISWKWAFRWQIVIRASLA